MTNTQDEKESSVKDSKLRAYRQGLIDGYTNCYYRNVDSELCSLGSTGLAIIRLEAEKETEQDFKLWLELEG